MTSRADIAGRLAQRVRRGPPPLLLIVLLCGVAVQTFLGANFPASADGKLHLYRLIEFDHALRHGYYFPRWSPDLVYGYGFPLFNYYAPLPYYAGSLFHLSGLSYQSATQATFIAFILLAGWATYRWVGDLFGPRAGLVAAAAYVYAPYTGLVNVHRGALGEMAGLALMPLILGAFTRLADRLTRGRFLAATLSLAALLVAHNLTSLLFAPIFLSALLILWLTGGREPRQAAALLGALLAGLALGAIFWLPAFTERHMVQVDRLFGPAAFDFRLHFLSLRDLFAPPGPLDPHLIGGSFSVGLGLPQVALSLAALWGVFSGRLATRQRALIAAAGAAALVLTALTLPFSLPLWESISLLRFVQFPWRLLGPASLFLALLAGAGIHSLNPRLAPLGFPPVRSLLSVSEGLPAGEGGQGGEGAVRGALPVLAALLIVAYGMWWLFGEYEAPLAASSVQDVQRFEVEYNAAGTTSFVDYLPTTVAELPPLDGLAERYAQADVITRLSTEELPEGAEILSQRAGVISAHARIDSPEAFTATWDWFAFPGWQATLDGQPVPITPSQPHGLIQVQVPAGRHRIGIRFRLTPMRVAGRITSLVGLTALLLVAWRLPPESDASRPSARPAWPDAWPVVGVVLLLTLKLAFLNHADSFYRHSRFDGQAVSGVASQAYVRFEDQMVYLGRDGAAEPVAAGDTLAVTLYWAPLAGLEADYSASAALKDDSGLTIAQADNQHPADWPTSRWRPDQYAADVHRLFIPPDTPPGQYTLSTAVYTPQSALAVLDEAGNPAGTTLDVATVDITRPDTPPDPAHIEVESRLNARLAADMELVGYDLSARALSPGDTLIIEPVWHALDVPADDLNATFALENAEGKTVLTRQVPLVSAAYPADAWPPGEVVRGRHALTLPDDLPGGRYALNLSVAGGDALSLGEIDMVEAAQPVFDRPDVQAEVDAAWVGGITLAGYDLPATRRAPGDTLSLTLIWMAPADLPASYKVFVHLADSSGEVRAQRDQIPADWTRPTTSWQPGEFITDAYELALDPDLPPGTYALRVGLYDEDSLEPLALEADGAPYLELAQVRIAAR